MSENLVQRAIRKIRPGSGGPAHAISIIDGQTGRAPTIATPRGPQVEDEDFDDSKSGMPMAVSTHFGAGPRNSDFPSGPLPGIDKEGNIPFYAPDDAGVLYRLFGMKGMSDD